MDDKTRQFDYRRLSDKFVDKSYMAGYAFDLEAYANKLLELAIDEGVDLRKLKINKQSKEPTAS